MKPILAAALAIAVATPAVAQGPYQPRAVPAQPSAGPVAAPAEPPVHFVGTFGADFGSKKIVRIPMEDGSERSLKANQGVNGSLGIAFLKLGGGKFVTQATIGVEYSAVEATNGSVSWVAFPLELMEFAYLDPMRLGAGLSYLLSPNVKGDGAGDVYAREYENAPGLVLQADYVWRLPRNARGGRMTFGARYVVQQLKPSSGGEAVDANAFGLVLGFTG